jgi:hypothetical protein
MLSQLDNATTGKVYGSVSQMMHIDLKVLKIDAVRISNGGHIAAGFVLCGVAQLLVRRWWVLPLAMIFFLGLEGGQLFSAERQADWMDVLRGWAGSVIAWGLVTVWVRLSRAKGEMCR